ncbi:hypothetical protein L3i22_046230 [Actinoplanes sp. L3-i22]|nr:hypothetical protein L3i22_046230 [Actinoplanes sp. L3-i22]
MVAKEIILARGSDAVVAVSGIAAYPNGFAFTLTVVLRQEDRRGELFNQAFHRDFYDEDPPSPGFLRLGVQFADGAAASNLGRHPHLDPSADPVGPLLMHGSGGGGGRRYETSYWVWPLPPPGPMTFVCEWPAHAIGESRAEVDAELIRDAATRSVSLLPDDEQTG